MAGIAYSLGDAYYNAYLAGFAVHSGALPADHPTHFLLARFGEDCTRPLRSSSGLVGTSSGWWA